MEFQTLNCTTGVNDLVECSSNYHIEECGPTQTTTHSNGHRYKSFLVCQKGSSILSQSCHSIPQDPAYLSAPWPLGYCNQHYHCTESSFMIEGKSCI